jgi:Uma2 family endonuclease
MVEEPQAEYQKSPSQHPQLKPMTLEEYWVFEYNAEGRHEYHDGVLIEMNYTSEPHGQICSNLTGLIFNCIREKDCSVYAENRMVYIPECNKNFYPDVLIVCGKHELKAVKKNMHATMNPAVIIEVLSNSTEDFDKTKKTKCYKKLRSLQQLIFIRQNEKHVQVLNRTDKDRIWIEIEAFDDDETVEIGDCTLSVKDIYHRVEIIDNTPEQASDK